MTRCTRYLPLLALLTGACAVGGRDADADDVDFDVEADGDTGDRLDEVASQYVINVYPNRDDADARPVLPQTFRVPTRSADGITLDLADSVQLDGTVTGYLVTPRSPTLPGQDTPVSAEVQLIQQSTIQSRFTATDDAGTFSLTAVPSTEYTLAIIPDDPLLPLYASSIALTSDVTEALDIGAGVAMWGQVTTELGGPLAGALVSAVHSSGVRTNPTVTDDEGFYLLRVTPGSYSIEVAGRDTGRDPVLTVPEAVVDDSGLRVDVAYDTLSLVSVGGRVTSSGNGLAGARIRLTARSLQGYDGRDAELQLDAIANSAGNFDTRVIPGTYLVEVLPPSDTSASYVSIEAVPINSDTDLGTLVAAPFRTVERLVVGPDAVPLSGAGVRCTETVGDGRSIASNTDADGLFSMALPRSPLSCFITPPGDAPDLAPRRLSVDLSTEEMPNIALGHGEPVSGTVTAERGVDVGLALIEVRDESGQLWGSTITDSEGTFSLRVEWVAPE